MNLRTGLALIVTLIAIFIQAPAVAESLLVTAIFWLQVGLGALTFLFIFALTGGSWGEDLAIAFRRLAQTITPTCLLTTTLVFHRTQIFPWSTHALEGHQAIYFNVYFFTARALFYLTIWCWLASRAQKCASDRLQRLAPGALLLLAFTVSFASFDWVMSLEPSWKSTVFGLLIISSAMLVGFAAAIAVTSGPQFSRRDQGNVLLALVMVWAYLSFSQYLVIWSGNLPDESSWYLHRMTSLWPSVTVLLAVSLFALPFVLLLFRKLKENRATLSPIAWLIIAASALHTIWLIRPSLNLHPEFSFLDVAFLITWAAVFVLAASQADERELESRQGASMNVTRFALWMVGTLVSLLGIALIVSHVMHNEYQKRAETKPDSKLIPLHSQFPDFETGKEIAQLRSDQEHWLNSYGWINEKQKILHIPIQVALKLRAQAQSEERPAQGGTR